MENPNYLKKFENLKNPKSSEKNSREYFRTNQSSGYSRTNYSQTTVILFKPLTHYQKFHFPKEKSDWKSVWLSNYLEYDIGIYLKM